MSPEKFEEILAERYTPAEALELGERIVAWALARLEEK